MIELALAERFTCPCGRSRTPLVVRADAATAGQLYRGVAGCPECHEEWPLADDRVAFGPRHAEAAVAFDDVEAVVALLAIDEPQRRVWLDGASPALASALVQTVAAQVLCSDEADDVGGVLHVDGARVVPLADATLHAALLLRPARDAQYVASVVQALQMGGRLVASTALAVPAEITELARAEPIWVGERQRRGAPVSLRRGGVR